ncbi:TPA: hypothetical protein ACNTIU_000713 [Escherichia coli]
MYTQTLYELSQEAERLLQLSRQQLQLLEKIPLSVPGDDAPQLALPWSQPNIAERHAGNDSNLLIVFYVQIMPDDFVMQLHRF